MLHGWVIHPPALGVHIVSVDDAPIASIPGARVVRRGDFIGVIAPKEADAVRAAAALKVTWQVSTAAAPVPAALYDFRRDAPSLGTYDVLKVGDVDAALAAKPKKLTAQYKFPYQLHAMIGPSCAVADVEPDRATLWSGTQWPQGTRNDVAKLLGLPADNVQLVARAASGAYGRMACDDALADAALLSQMVGRPVRVQWTRHDEHSLEPISQGAVMDVQGSLSDDGRIDAFALTYYAASTGVGEAGSMLAWRTIGSSPGNARLSGFPSDPPYQIPAQRSARAGSRYRIERSTCARPGFTKCYSFRKASSTSSRSLRAQIPSISGYGILRTRDRNVLQEAARLARGRALHRRPALPPPA